MTIWYALTLTGSPVEIRVGSPRRFARIKIENVGKFKQHEVSEIRAHAGKLILYAQDPDLELEAFELEEYELDEDQEEDVLPWY